MTNDIIFSRSFYFTTYRFLKYRHNDNSGGINKYYFANMVRGRGRLSAENETVEISEGDIFFIPNGTKYHSYWYGEPEVEFISLGFTFFPNFEGRYYPVQAIKGSTEAIEIMKRLAASECVDATSVGDFYTLAAMLLPDMIYKENGRQAALVERAKRYIAANPTETVRDVARALAVSESALYAAFSAHSDTSINEFKKETVLKRARELLISTDLSVEEIGRMLNFSSGAYFRKCFKDYFSLSPREMRRTGGI